MRITINKLLIMRIIPMCVRVDKQTPARVRPDREQRKNRLGTDTDRTVNKQGPPREGHKASLWGHKEI